MDILCANGLGKITEKELQSKNCIKVLTDKNKNAISISSNQSMIISSFDDVKYKYENTKLQKDLSNCPDYWGGFSFIPFYFEFCQTIPSLFFHDNHAANEFVIVNNRAD